MRPSTTRKTSRASRPRSKSVNLDRLSCLPRTSVAHATFGIFDGLQRLPHAETRIAALACALLLAARRYGVSPNKLWETANNIMHDADKKQVPEFAGAARYLREEM